MIDADSQPLTGFDETCPNKKSDIPRSKSIGCIQRAIAVVFIFRRNENSDNQKKKTMAFQAKNSGNNGRGNSNVYVCAPSRSPSGKMVLTCSSSDRSATPASRPVQSRSSSSSSNSDRCDYDVIIIGAGTSGSVAAKYISDNEDLSVLVLEAGENQNENVASKFPFGPLAGPSGDPANLYGFVQRHGINLLQPAFHPLTTDALNGSDLKGLMDAGILTRPLHGGRGWGGASNHNYLASYMSSSQFDQYLADNYGNSDWSSFSINSIKRELETYIPADGPIGENGRGTNGPLIISKDTDSSVPYIASIQAAFVDPVVNKPTDLPGPVDTAASAPLESDINRPGRTTVRVSQLNQYLDPTTAERTHAGNTFLGPDIVDQNTGKGVGNRRLQVISKATVVKILFKGKTAYGVEVLLSGKSSTFTASKKIILSAGSLRSPGILERSGVGDASRLASLGIPLVQHSPLVGNNYMNQPASIVFVNISPQVAVPQAGAIAELNFPGNSPYGHDRYGTHRFVGGPVKAFEPYYPDEVLTREHGADLDSISTLLGISYNETPTSRGSVHIVNDDPLSDPVIIRNYVTTADDVRFARETVRMMKRMETRLAVSDPSLGFTVVVPPPSVDFNDDEELDPWLAALTFPTDHYMGTCQMGKNASSSVVSPTLHVHGLKHLMVADLSIMPVPPDTSPAYVAMVIGRQAAHFCLDSI